MIKFRVASPPIAFEDYFTKEQPFEVVCNIMVGDLQRIVEYPKQGFQIPQKVPKSMLRAMHFLVEHGYNKHLLQR